MSATAMRFDALSMWSSISSIPGFSIRTWNVPVRRCSRTSDTWYGMSRATDARPIASDARPLRERPRMEPIRKKPSRVGLRHLEHVEVGVDLLPHRRERRDRLVEDHEPARELQVHRVDEREALADDLDRVDVREPAAVVAVEEHLQLGAELLFPSGVVADARARAGDAGWRRRSPSRRRRRASSASPCRRPSASPPGRSRRARVRRNRG